MRAPSYDELADMVTALNRRLTGLETAAQKLRDENSSLRDENTALAARVAELQAQIRTNSTNSSKPPSTDGLTKPAPKSLRRKTDRKPGGQPGHPGSTLEQVADPDEVLRHEPISCTCCGAELTHARQTGLERRQVFDLPPLRVHITEHQIITRSCTSCGSATSGHAPTAAAAPVQYGPRIAALVVYLYAGQFLSKKRTAQALAELFNTPLSAGTVASLTARAADQLDTFTRRVTATIAAAELAHFDETGLRVAGKLRWVHSASTDTYSLITCHDRRGIQGMNDAGVLPTFTGIAVHDAWAPYDSYPNINHALCNAHVLRELQAVIDTAPTGTWCWADQAARALTDLKHLVDTARNLDATLASLDTHALADARHRLRSAVLIGIATTAARTDKLMAKHHALARRLHNRHDDYLRFTTDPRVPFDNNAAEREIRMIKLRQKVSGCLRTLTGAQQFCAIRSYLATATKHGLRTYDTLIKLTNGQPWLPQPT